MLVLNILLLFKLNLMKNIQNFYLCYYYNNNLLLKMGVLINLMSIYALTTKLFVCTPPENRIFLLFSKKKCQMVRKWKFLFTATNEIFSHVLRIHWYTKQLSDIKHMKNNCFKNHISLVKKWEVPFYVPEYGWEAMNIITSSNYEPHWNMSRLYWSPT